MVAEHRGVAMVVVVVGVVVVVVVAGYHCHPMESHLSIGIPNHLWGGFNQNLQHF